MRTRATKIKAYERPTLTRIELPAALMCLG
jgi:hypothetical protein